MGAALFSPSPRLEVHNLRTLIPRHAREARNQGRGETGMTMDLPLRLGGPGSTLCASGPISLKGIVRAASAP